MEPRESKLFVKSRFARRGIYWLPNLFTIMALCAQRIRDFGRYRLAEAKTCFYDVQPQERFIVERLGRQGWVMSGFSGHGFKFGPALPLELARAVAGSGDAARVASWASGVLVE